MDESFFGFGISREVRREKFQGNGALQRGVLGFVNDTHASTTKTLEDLIVGDRLPDGRGHGNKFPFRRDKKKAFVLSCWKRSERLPKEPMAQDTFLC